MKEVEETVEEESPLERALKITDLMDLLKDVKMELGSILDTLIELLPRQNPNYIQEYALLMARVRELIRDIEKYV